MDLNLAIVKNDVQQALHEDIQSGDVTAELLDNRLISTAVVYSQEDAVLCGCEWFEESFNQLSSNISIHWDKRDGQLLTTGARVARMSGPIQALVSAERTALNFLQLLSGTATTTHKHVQLLKGSNITLLDTRKTIPGLRHAQKYAVAVGGGGNHRQGLWDAFMIKENHIHALGGLAMAVKKARKANSKIRLLVEVESLAELEEAVKCNVEHIMLDGLPMEDVVEGLHRWHGSAKFELTGDVDIKMLPQLAELGLDYISMGALTKHIQAINFSMRVQPLGT